MASKDISIELLQTSKQYRYGSELLCNENFSNATCWLVGASWTLTGGVCIKYSGGSGADLYLKNPITLIEGYTYEIEVAVKNYNRVGSLLLANHGYAGANVTIFDSTTICNGCDGNTSQYAYIKKQWTQGDNSTSLANLSLYAHATTEMTISWAKLYRTAAAGDVVQGRLDASTTDDFPLAITFSVNDPSNIDARKGAYSKTFQIPATKNNNQVLKHLNIANSTNIDAVLQEKIPCRILVGNLFSMVGLMQIKGIERLNNKPSFYECVFLGDNLAWSTYLDGKYLSDLQLPNSTNLHLSAKNVIKSWQRDDCQSSTTRGGTNTVNDVPVVYPVATYGYTNETGNLPWEAMQIFREMWEEDYIDNYAYNNSETGIYGASASFPYGYTTGKEPVNDWRPMVWIYNMMHKIFNDVGYKISSAFMETTNFKRLLYATPNFLYNNMEQREQANSFRGNFKDDSSCSATSTNLRFFDNTISCTLAVTSVGSGNVVTGYASLDTTQDGEEICLWGICGSTLGSALFQPASGVTVNAGGVLQQDVTMSVNPAIGGERAFTKWYIERAGYYEIKTSSLMWGVEFQGETGTGGASDWSGSGDFTNQQYTGIEFYGQIGVEVKTVGEQDWFTRTTLLDGEGQQLTGYLDCNGSGSTGTYAIYDNLDATSYIGYFNAGDSVRLHWQMRNKMNVYNTALNYTGYTTLDFRFMIWGTSLNNWAAKSGSVTIEIVNADIPVFGGIYNLQDVFPNDQKQLDFVKGVAHCFNLQFNTVESQKTVYIEPFSDFYLPPASAIDWTWKLARNMSDKQTFIENDFARTITFKYKTDDKDWRVKDRSEKYFNSVGDEYPYQTDLGNLYPAGERIFENPFFAGTYDSQGMEIGDMEAAGTNFYAAALWEDAYGRTNKGYEFMPRILRYNKMAMPSVHSPIWQGFSVEMANTYSSPARLFQYAGVQIADVTTYAVGTFPTYTNFSNAFYTSATFVNRYDFSNQFGLSYGNYWAKDYDPATNSYNAVGNQLGVGLYDRYYRSMIDNLVDKPKVRICYIDLKIKDITQLDFRKMVYIDGVYYRLIKVFDYQPHLNIPTKVELHQFSPAKGNALPTSGVWINNNVGSGTNTGGGWGDSWPDNPVNNA